MNQYSINFKAALENSDLSGLKQIPKAEFHNHAGLGFKLWRLEKFYNTKIPQASSSMISINEIGHYIETVLRPFYSDAQKFETALGFAFQEAQEDGIVHLEMSIDIFFSSFYKNTKGFCDAIKRVAETAAPAINFIPEIGITRTMPMDLIEKLTIPLIESGYFKSIDLYDDELAVDPIKFREIYRSAEKLGLKRKVHVGEFGDAHSIRKAVELLRASEVQHGISAAQSPEIMKWLRENNIQLNVCPTSNVVMQRVKSLKAHPARILFDHGVKISINTDDILIFNQTLSEEYLNLYKAGVFSAEELDSIRRI